MKNRINRVKSITLVISIVLLVLMLSGCIHFNVESTQSGEPEYTYHNLNVVLVPGDTSEESRHIAAAVQEYLDNTPIALHEGELNFLFFDGRFHYEYQITQLVGIFINATDSVITNISGDLAFSCDGSDLNAGEGEIFQISFSEEYVGELDPDDAMLVFLNFPTAGLSEDVVIGTFDLSTTFENVTFTTR